MKIIIPMTGYGSRFTAAGYKELKPFIRVQGKPVIQWIIDGMYPGEKDILFVCRKEHLDTIPYMRTLLKETAPSAEIFGIDDWVKKGPVYDVLRAAGRIEDEVPCIINYCDFYMYWNWQAFKREVAKRECEGCVPCYTGFHPNLIPAKNVYASCLTDEQDNLIEIREKYSFEKDKMKAKHSPGVYYFRSGALLKKYCRKLVDSGETLNGEYYASLPYNFMVADGLRVWVPTNVEQFCQWGTPEDLQEYLFWTGVVRGFARERTPGEKAESDAGQKAWKAHRQMPGEGRTRRKMNIIIPMAGEGKRFSEKGYTVHKPAIPTIDRRTGRELPMVVCAVLDLPGVEAGGANVTFIDRDFHKRDGVEQAIRNEFPNAGFLTTDRLTEGQACTCLLARDRIDNAQELLIAGCDNGMIFDADRFEREKQQADCLVFTYRNNESVLINPDAYGWMIADEENTITGLSIKKAVSENPMKDHAVVATFWFREGSIFVRAAQKMIAENDRINGEFYVDEVVRHVLALGYRAKVFEIGRYIGWGTPEDYENYMQTIRYWERFLQDERCQISE